MSAAPYAKLSEVAFLNPPLGGRLPDDDLVSFVPMASLSAETAKIETTQDRHYSEVSKGFTPFLSGDVLVAKITPCFENGKIAQALLPRRNGFGSTEFHVVRARLDVSDARYLHHYLRLDAVRVEGQRRMTGSGGQRRVPANFLSGLRVPLPPLEEQRRIATILDQAETLRTQRRQALAHLDTLTQSLFLDMFGDPVTNDRGWLRSTLGGVAAAKPNNGVFRKNPEYVQAGLDGLPVVWVEELFRGDLIDTQSSRRLVPTAKELENYGLRFGDLLFCRSSLKLDGIAYNNVYLGESNEALFECHLIRVSPDLDRVSPIYMNHLLRLPMMRAAIKTRAKTSTMTTIDQQGLCAVSIVVPPLALQQTFATRIQAIEALKATHRTALAQLDALFASLQQRAFAGAL